MFLLLFPCLLTCGRNDNPTSLNPGTIPAYLSSDPSGAEIIIDDLDTQATTPDTILLTEGSHTITLRLCDYQDWNRTLQQVSEGDTLDFTITLTPTFSFFDDFESGGVNWSAGCPYNIIDPNSYDSSNCLRIMSDSTCSTRLINTYAIPQCLEPHVSFHYKLVSGEAAVAFMRIDDDGGNSYYIRLDEARYWTQMDVPPTDFSSLSGTVTFWFEINYSDGNQFNFYLDDFSLSAQQDTALSTVSAVWSPP
jgi:hypothetical protein